MKETAYVLLMVTFFIPIILGVYWLLWKAWGFVLNGFGASQAIAYPDYWIFVVGMLLFAYFASFFRSQK